nr:MAG TPA: hypothetical protein [Caudoviricetes sp.]
MLSLVLSWRKPPSINLRSWVFSSGASDSAE